VEILEKRGTLEPDELMILGEAYFKLGKINKALANFKRIVDVDPDNIDAHFNLAKIYLHLEKYSKAKYHITKVLPKRSKDWIVYDILASILIFEGFYHTALPILEQAISLASGDTKATLLDKLTWLKERMEAARNQPKLAFVCQMNLDNFIDDIIKGLQDEYWVQRWVVANDRAIRAAVDWADIVWFEWANESTVRGTNYFGIEGKPSIVRLHRYEAFYHTPRKINWKVVNTLIFVSEFMIDVFFEFFPELKKEISNVEVVYNAVDMSKIPFKERKPGYEIAWAGYVIPRKSPALAIQVIHELVKEEPRYRLHVAGDYSWSIVMETYLKTIIEGLNLEKNVILYGWVDDMDEFFEDKNYILHTSLHESFGYSIVEAMGRGIKPVIHWFEGADELYDKNWLFASLEDAKRIIMSKDYDSSQYRSYIEKKGWTIENQIGKIKEILGKMR